MARMTVSGLDGQLAQFEQLARQSEEACKAAVTAGGKALAPALSKAAPVLKSARRGVTPGALRDSIKVSKPKVGGAGDGVYVEVKPEGSDHGQSLAKIGNILEYGRSNMAAQPWFESTIMENEEAVKAAMAAEFAHYQRMNGG